MSSFPTLSSDSFSTFSQTKPQLAQTEDDSQPLAQSFRETREHLDAALCMLRLELREAEKLRAEIKTLKQENTYLKQTIAEYQLMKSDSGPSLAMGSGRDNAKIQDLR